MSTEAVETIPYPLPRNWQDRGMPVKPVGRVAIMTLVAALLLAFGARGALLGDLFGVVLWAVFYAALMCGVAVARVGPGRIRGPVLMNAVALTRAKHEPPDSWVHFFREEFGSRVLGWALLFGGLGSGALLTTAGVRAVATGAGWWLYLVIPLGLGAAVLVLCGAIALVVAVRSASFGRIPVGLSIGRSGIVRYYLDAIETVRWEDIRSVTAIEREDRDTEGGRDVLIDREGQDPWRVGVDQYATPAWVLYAALRYWHEHPEARTELSTTFAQRRIEQWCAAMQDQNQRRAPAGLVEDAG
ncbi:hypothetical protein [Microbacterium sp. 22242]|uniref:hypothetical protein n=1 Tax=Microbacterium sp. 22242 TaxID=3453896 RepID=UPI003F875A30